MTETLGRICKAASADVDAVGLGVVSLWDAPLSPEVRLMACSALREDGSMDTLAEAVELVVRVATNSIEAIALEHVLTGDWPAHARVPVRAQFLGWEVSGEARFAEPTAEHDWDGWRPVDLRLEIVRGLRIERAEQGSLF